jgi:hypothetical protein
MERNRFLEEENEQLKAALASAKQGLQESRAVIHENAKIRQEMLTQSANSSGI